MKIHVIVAAHNRKLLTSKAVMLAQNAGAHAGVDISFTIFDDGSTDGTAEILSRSVGRINVLNGDGSNFWAKSMAAAEADVLNSRPQDADDEFILWLNDDVELDFDSIERLTDEARLDRQAIIVGAMRDPATGTVTYSGFARHGWHPLRFELVQPGLNVQSVDTFNGNLVLVPLTVARTLRGIDGSFSHALADIDYGLRATHEGVRVLLAPGTFGTCSRNPPLLRLSLWKSWKRHTGVKGGGNFTSLNRVLRRHAPIKWPFAIMISYALWWFRAIRPGSRAK
jgi:GT2 family glycosyltransferase